MIENQKTEVKCPNCKSTNVTLVERRDDNGIIGSGYASWVVDSYYSCKSCRLRFDTKSE